MAYTIRIDCTQNTLDSDENASDNKTFTISQSFETREVKSFVLPAGSNWYAIPFGTSPTQTYSAVLLKLLSDQDVEIKVNGLDTYQSGVLTYLYQGSLSQLQIRNNSGLTANVQVEIYA